MTEENITEVNTKLKAYKLVHDPTVLLSLIFSKYGDIEEDLELLYINQLVYDKSSRYNIFFKEFNFYYNDDEYLKRYYKKYESKPRIPKLSEYYKNYHVFFCRPRFKDLLFSDLIQSYEDDRAEIFYKKNFENSNSKDDDDKDKSQKHNSESLSSLDNITYNKIIFTKKTKKMIDNNLDSKNATLTLTSNSFNTNGNNCNNKNEKNNNSNISNNSINKLNNNEGLISSRNANDSFEKIVHNLIFFKKTKKKIEKNKNKNNINNNNNNKNNIKSKEKNKIKEEKGYAPNKNFKKENNMNKNIINKKKTVINKRNNKISFFSLLKQANTITYTKQSKNNIINNKNKNNLNNEFFSQKIYSFPTKLEEFHNNLIKQTNTSHHQRNKTFNYNQNQSSGINNNNFNNIINANNNNSKNDFNHLKNMNYKQFSQFNKFLTMNNNNLINSQKISQHNNKTFDNSPNKNNSIIKKIPAKIIQKNISSHNNENINNQIIIKRNNLVKTKFNLIKSPLNRNTNNKINLNKNVKNNNFKYYNTKFSPSNIFYRNLLNNNNINSHKKSQTTYLSPEFDISPKNNPSSPKIINRQQKQFYNINKSDNISSKIKPKLVKGRINNLNINFNNVIFNGPLSNINENINFNNNIISNNSNSFNIISNSNNNNLKNNTFLNNINFLNNSSNINNNISEGDNVNDKNIYIMNLKNVYNNISRNKMSLYGTSFSQTDNFSLTKNNTKIQYHKNTITNHTYSNLMSNEKPNIKKSRVLNKKLNYKSGNQKNSKKIIKNNPKKTKNIKMSSKKLEHGNNVNHFKREKKKGKENEEKNNASYEKKEKENNDSKNIYISPNTTGRNIAVHPINVNRNSNLLSKKTSKSRQIIK